MTGTINKIRKRMLECEEKLKFVGESTVQGKVQPHVGDMYVVVLDGERNVDDDYLGFCLIEEGDCSKQR